MKKNFFYINFFSLLISFLMISCGSPKEGKMTDKSSGSATGNDISKIWNDTKDYTFEQRVQFKDDVEKAKEKLSNKIDELQKKAGVSRGYAKENYNNAVEKLKEEKEIVNKRMNDFNDVTKENWNDFKSGVNSIWSDIERTWMNANENT